MEQNSQRIVKEYRVTSNRESYTKSAPIMVVISHGNCSLKRKNVENADSRVVS